MELYKFLVTKQINTNLTYIIQHCHFVTKTVQFVTQILSPVLYSVIESTKNKNQCMIIMIYSNAINKYTMSAINNTLLTMSHKCLRLKSLKQNKKLKNQITNN